MAQKKDLDDVRTSVGPQGPEFDVPAHIFRLSHDDGHRTKLLKDVLRSSAKLQEENGKKKQPRKIGFSKGEATPPAARRDRSRRKTASGVTLTELAACQESDEAFAAMASGGDSSPLLKTCGQRISGLCERLRLADRQLKTTSAEAKAAEACDVAPENEIRIMDRPDEAPGIARARNDRVVYDFVSKHAHFTRLEDFKDKVDKAAGYEGLREIIPQRFKHHPNMTLMNDTVLTDPAKLREAMWNRPKPPGANSELTDLRTKLQSRMAVGLKASTNSSSLAARRAARTLRLDHSAPALL